MKPGTPSATPQGAGSPPRSLRTCPQGHQTCWPYSCPVCRAMATPYEGRQDWIVTMGARAWRVPAGRVA
jgi:hypothetical protein